MDLIDPHTFNMMDQDSEGRIIPATSAREIRNLRINEYSKQGVRVGIRGTRRIHNETFDFDTLGDEIITVNPEDPPIVATIKYGALYNWSAATDVRDISNTGWRVPSNADFLILQTAVGGGLTGGGSMKETGYTYWDSPNEGATNTTKFNGRGAGLRNPDGSFAYINQYSAHQTTDALNNGFELLFDIASLLQLADSALNLHGSPIRLVKATTTLSNGQEGVYTGNDGKVYRTICIGTQEWLADNLDETKYKNGDIIPIITDDTAWSELTTGAKCYYDNDPLNA